MGIEREKIPTQSGTKASKSRLWHGCLILIIPLAIYIIHGLIVLIPNEVNRHKWLTANSSN
jgi:hypothetical protein